MRALRPQLPDIALALLVTLIGIGGTLAGAHRFGPDVRAADPGALALVIAAGAALLLRRALPLAVLGTVALLVSTYLLLGNDYGPILLSLLVAVFTVARHRPARTAGVAAGAALLVLLIPTLVTGPGLRGLLPAAAWVVVPFALGLTVQVRREAVARQREEALRRHVDDERLRIAQEVHDVVGHGLAAIKMQADVALHVLPNKPDQAEVALEAISRTSSDALDELRATLAVLRTGTGREAAPGLARVSDLVQRTREAGLEVSLRVRGEQPELPTAVDLTGYRVLQEALTNVLRHGEGGRGEVAVDYAADAVTIEVSNPHSGSAGEGGLGIPGMRRRVEALGGEFTAETTAGRFRVRARLPLEDAQ
ncbi:sensor histidine kinase [Saccharopolyspora griseoalba]|uniref:histidine kinase n=1 Tax=Saccharopolyspora griseoalba TaxID=1431848 RepID=A0ABW2LDJ2_9PSEU